MPSHVLLDDRGVLTLSGPDRSTFLQGLISNDVRQVGPDRAVFSAFLTPQGKYLHDFFLMALGDEGWAIDCEGARRDDLLRRLRPYRLRSQVTLADATPDWVVAAVFGPDAAAAVGLDEAPGQARPFGDGVAMVDARLAALGVRLLLPRDRATETLAALGTEATSTAAYDAHRLMLGVPAGSRDMQVEKSTLLESGFDELNGISWDKGCYMGQELTARTKYRGLVKRRLVPVRVDGPLPDPGTPILANGKQVGEVRGGSEGRAIALLRLEALTAEGLVAGESQIVPERPDWAGW